MKKLGKVLIVGLMAALFAMCLTACVAQIEEEAVEIEKGVVEEFGGHLAVAKEALATAKAEVEKLGDEGMEEAHYAISEIETHFENAKTAIESTEEGALDVAKEELARAEAEYEKFAKKAEDLGADASDELTMAIEGLKEGINKLKSVL